MVRLSVDPDRSRRQLGLALFVGGVGLGLLLDLLLFVVPALASPKPLRTLGVMVLSAALALPAAALYLSVPRLLDRYDPEPLYALLGCLLWGATFATGVSAAVNSAVGAVASSLLGEGGGEAISAVLSAPIVEEATKGLAVLGVFWFLRREFDGYIDGLLYATFTAVGFATVENVLYYAKGAATGGGAGLAATFFARGILSPWAHPVFTSVTGLGIGWARESVRPAARWLGPLLGYAGAVTLHAAWNGLATLSAVVSPLPFLLALPLWLLLVAGYLVLVWRLAARRARILRSHLQDELALGNLSAEEVDLVASSFGLKRARRMWGPDGEELLRAAARLAMHKWHLTRAMASKKSTMSGQLIGPLRQRVAELKGRIAARASQQRAR